MQFLDVKTDIAFKKVFGSEQHKDILIGFLNAVLDLQGDKSIAEVTLKNPWQPPDLSILKETILDIKAVDNRGISFIVEMQVKGKYAFQKRAQYYTAKAYTSQIDKGEDYPKLGQVIFIGILNFNCFEGSDFLTRHLILNLATQRQELKDIEFNFIELTKFDKTEEQLQGIVDKWIYFIKNADNLTMIPQSAAAIPELNNAYTQASILTWTKDELDIYEYWRMEETSDRYKMQEEYDKGRRDEQRKTILAMSSKGMAAEFIADTLNLKVDLVQQVLAE
jgi:predicted transposase/invertase (TIGR01784 family)